MSISLAYLAIAFAVGIVGTVANHHEYSRAPRRFAGTLVMFTALGLFWLPALVAWAVDESRV